MDLIKIKEDNDKARTIITNWYKEKYGGDCFKLDELQLENIFLDDKVIKEINKIYPALDEDNPSPYRLKELKRGGIFGWGVFDKDNLMDIEEAKDCVYDYILENAEDYREYWIENDFYISEEEDDDGYDRSREEFDSDKYSIDYLNAMVNKSDSILYQMRNNYENYHIESNWCAITKNSNAIDYVSLKNIIPFINEVDKIITKKIGS